MTTRTAITEASVPALPRGVKLRFDKQRDRWVLLAPERLFVLDDIALEIVKRCKGEATIDEISDDLARSFSAPKDVVMKDVIALLQDLTDKRILSA
jgi:pyrroloquinoline quinone biosynthesis protein D